MKIKPFGRYIVADPGICHGEPSFRGTRILVADILEQVARGMDWQAITEEWRGSVSKEAITEAVQLARELFVTHASELILEKKTSWIFWMKISPKIKDNFYENGEFGPVRLGRKLGIKA
jgi:uncharacterized protein (DUF433 family)